MSNGIVLSSSIRSNLLTLQNTAEMQGRVQERLATGKKVNSTLDNPTNFFTAAGLNRRATDLGALLDGMSNGIQTLKAADSGMTSITKTVETMRAYVQQARQDKSFKGLSYTLDTAGIGTASVKNLSLSGGRSAPRRSTSRSMPPRSPPPTPPLTGAGGFAAAGSTLGGTPAAITVQATGLNGGAAVSVGALAAGDDVNAAATKINPALDAATGGDGGITASVSGGQIVFTNTSGNNVTLAGDNATLNTAGFASANRASTNGVAGSTGAVKTVDELVTAINANASLADKVRASNDGGKLRIENLSTESLTVVGASAIAVNGAAGASNTSTVGGNDVRKNLITQFNELRRQLDKIGSDSSYNGVNLLRGDKLKVVFNEVATSVLEVQGKSTAGVVRGLSTEPNSLDIGLATAAEFSDDAQLDQRLQGLSDALTVVQTQASSFGANLATVQIRQEFTMSIINTLQTGAGSSSAPP